ncbi:MAG: LamG domain-containing protein [Planctomycetes bacterium]|nr:LamG domain-containing protein [Planctomycetota bacterium]
MYRKKICLVSFVLVLSMAGNASADLMAHWKFNEASGNTVEDASGNGNTGTTEDALWVGGKDGPALEFNGQTARVVVPDSPSLHSETGDISILAWIKVASDPTTWSNAGPMVFKQYAYQWNVNNNGALWFGIWGARLESIGTYNFSDHVEEWHHATLTFVGATQMASIYVDGELHIEGVVSEAIDPTTNELYIGFKDDGGTYFHGVIDDVRIYDHVLMEAEILAAMEGSGKVDVTAPGDLVQGFPNDGLHDGSRNFGWWRWESPDLAIDDNIETKYLHFKGETETTGFQVTPRSGPSIVTGLTLTTANDFPGRDPIAFEFSGSNEGIDGPYELIASDYVVDFAQALSWPRFTMNITPISFNNDTAYAHYQLLFPAVRGPVVGSVNSMQIAEVELLGISELSAPAGANIILVTEAIDWDLDGLRDDHSLESFLVSEGYNVDIRPDYWKTLDPDKINELNAADLIIFSRLNWSRNYDEGNETTEWNSLTTPLLQMSSWFVSNIRWNWVNSDVKQRTPLIYAEAVEPYHPIFQGVPLTALDPSDPDGPLTVVQMVDPLIGTGLTSFIQTTNMGNGHLIAKPVQAGMGWIAEWDVGVEFFEGAGQYTGGRRILFCAGTQETRSIDPDTQEEMTTAQGELNLTAEGLQMFRNAIDYMLRPQFTEENFGLVEAAEATYLACLDATRGGTNDPTNEIYSTYWADGIKALNPVKVYTHRINMVVVQHISNGTEEGKYIVIPISSYMPMTGDDGFVFSPEPLNGNTYTMSWVFDFKRTRSK